MVEEQLKFDDYARACARTAAAEFKDLASYIRGVDDETWNGPSACEKWKVRDVAGHAVGEAVWFPNLARGLIQGEEALPPDVYERMKGMSPTDMADRLEDGATQICPTIDGATPDELREAVDMGFIKMPLWQATYVSALEATLHNWDARAIQNPDAVISTNSATIIASGMAEMSPHIAHGNAIAGAEGLYLLKVSDAIGSVIVTAKNDAVTVQPRALETPDVTIYLSVEQYVRLLTGRLSLDSTLLRDKVSIEGNHERARGLNRIFAGIANG